MVKPLYWVVSTAAVPEICDAGQTRLVHERTKDDKSESILTATCEAVVGSVLCLPRTHAFYDANGNVQRARQFFCYIDADLSLLAKIAVLHSISDAMRLALLPASVCAMRCKLHD